DGVGFELPITHLTESALGAAEPDVDMASDQVLNERWDAAVRNKLEVSTSLLLEKDSRDLVNSTASDRTCRHLVGICFQPSDQLPEIFRRQVLSPDKPVGAGSEHRNRFEIVQWVVLDVGIGRRAHDMRTEIANAERIAIGCGAHDPSCRDGSTSPGGVLND